MHERLVEDWLIRSNERGFEIPFCHLLVGEGHRVVHLTRHGEMEQGKDILASSGLPIIPANDLGDAAKKIVAEVKSPVAA